MNAMFSFDLNSFCSCFVFTVLFSFSSLISSVSQELNKALQGSPINWLCFISVFRLFLHLTVFYLANAPTPTYNNGTLCVIRAKEDVHFYQDKDELVEIE